MNSNNLLLLKGDEINHLLAQRENEILNAVQLAYQIHAKGNSNMPPNGYLRFPNMEKERIIAKPAYLGGSINTAGIKWIASFPNNIKQNMDRASATLILNSVETGQPTAIMESSIISAKRTAASAALAARELWIEDNVTTIGLIGCGLINYEILRFLLAIYPMIKNIYLYDLSLARAEEFKHKSLELNSSLNIEIKDSLALTMQKAAIISFATTAITPFVNSLYESVENAVLLNVSLRDVSADLILQADNIVDDIEQVCSNKTSIHLAQQQVGHNDFVRTTIGDILNGDAKPRDMEKPFAIYSPFGLGILDMAVADLTQKLALEQNLGTNIEGFLPKYWLDR